MVTELLKRKKIKWGKIITIIVIIVGLIFALFPLVWVFTTSIKPREEIFSFPAIYIPSKITFENYINAWKTQPITRWYINTIIVSVGSTIISMLFSTMAGYGFSRFSFKGKEFMLIAILLSQMFPVILIVIEYFVYMTNLNLTNTYIGLILAYLGGALPFSIWMLKGFFDTVPKELDEAAIIDGCNYLSAFYRIVLPLSAPGISAATLYAFLVAWNNYIYSLILVTKDKMMTLNVGITIFIAESRVDWGALNAVAVITSLPLIIAFVYLEKYMIAGLSIGAVKG